jgi:hypothetical protein
MIFHFIGLRACHLWKDKARAPSLKAMVIERSSTRFQEVPRSHVIKQSKHRREVLSSLPPHLPNPRGPRNKTPACNSRA